MTVPDVTPAELAEALDSLRLQVAVEGCYDLSGHRIGITLGTVIDPARVAHALHRELGEYAARHGEPAPDRTSRAALEGLDARSLYRLYDHTRFPDGSPETADSNWDLGNARFLAAWEAVSSRAAAAVAAVTAERDRLAAELATMELRARSADGLPVIGRLRERPDADGWRPGEGGVMDTAP